MQGASRASGCTTYDTTGAGPAIQQCNASEEDEELLIKRRTTVSRRITSAIQASGAASDAVQYAGNDRIRVQDAGALGENTLDFPTASSTVQGPVS